MPSGTIEPVWTPRSSVYTRLIWSRKLTRNGNIIAAWIVLAGRVYLSKWKQRSAELQHELADGSTSKVLCGARKKNTVEVSENFEALFCICVFYILHIV